ncbi:MAG: tetratricopeptide repeat protein [Bacteroidetes bacterium]|nr:tetratricopeptide repeat protein [Bacteroidota bacterium]
MQIKRFIYPLAFVLLFVACSTKKNTVVSRAYHNMTARYNGYYYSCENIDEGVYKIEKANKDNFDKILPVYIYPAGDKAKATFPEFDKAIKKSSTCIQRHAIKDKKGNEIPASGKWIDNNWINIGISHLYKRELFSGLEAFEYVARTYTKSKDKYTAMAWMIKTNNEIGSVSSSEQIISLLKNEKDLPRKVKKELPVLEADYFMRRGLNTEAATKLMEASRSTGLFRGMATRKKRARYSFIVAQLFEQQKNNKRAVEYYKKTIRLKPNYELVFYSKIKIAKLLDVKRNNSEGTKKDLLKMAKEFKNNEYYDVIYYTLGEIEEKERNAAQAMIYYKKSVQTSLNNPNQKGLSYLKLGEINFDLTNYQPAEAYYDSAVVTISKDHPDYGTIVARKKTLETLVGHIRTINKEDSLQRFVSLSENEQNRVIDRIIANLEKEEARKEKEKEILEKSNILPGTINQPSLSEIAGPGSAAASFYFYNPSTVAFGVSDFVKKWGNRKLEDNWRRSNKALIVEVEKEDTAQVKTTSVNVNKTRDFYRKGLPVNDSLIKKSNKKIVYSYYMMGSIYKEELNNTKKAVATFEELNTRFPQNKYLLNTYYILYRTYLSEKNQPKADFYKEKILNEFPDSEFALIIKNPEYATSANSKKSEVEGFYTTVYQSYLENNYSQAYAQSNEGLSKFGKNVFVPKFEFIKALSAGKLKGIDSLEFYLKLLVVKHPQSEVTPLANDILLSIKRQKNPELFKSAEPGKLQLDTFTVNQEAEHFIIAILPDDPKIADSFKIRLNTFNNTYYSSKTFNSTSNLFGNNKQLVVLKSFANAKEVVNYYENLIKDPELFKEEVKKELVEIYPILGTNLPVLYKKKNVEAYKIFFNDNYKNLNENKIK